MKRVALALLLALQFNPAVAFWQSRDSNYNVKVTAAGGGGYTGAGDVLGGAVFYYSCTRAWNAAYATAHGSACDLLRASDSTTCTMVFLTTGNADVATTSSCTTGTQTVTQFCNATTCTVSKTYDQTGNGSHATQGTAANAPTFDPAGAKVMVFAGNQWLSQSASGPFNQIYSMSVVAKRTSGTSFSCILCISSGNDDIGFHGANTATVIWNGPFADASAADNSCHALQGVANGASSSLMVDGTANTGLSPGNSPLTNPYQLGAISSPNFQLTGTIREVIFYSSDITSSQSALSTNQTSYGGC